MKYKLVELSEFTGNAATVYSIVIDDDKETLFEKFINENLNIFKSEIINILNRLEIIGHETGAREIFFKTKEGKPGDGVEALFDKPKYNLRLYCIRYGTQIVILGGGGYKPKSIKAFQEDEKLKSENYLLQKISREISIRIKERRITYSPDGYNFVGEIEFEDETHE